ncbi:LOW QUALITY PROTEIN: mucin-5AC [Pituophis catenifer annectens]|uniref:LOW QUALITY PROTEIN: mucin-5AC n=1 Tax=Pituophis catenifer annectens TaxID=94852 RepID=UPI003991AD21
MLPSSPGKMGIGRGTRIQLWIPILMIILSHQKVHAQYEEQQSQYEDQQSQYEDQQSQYEDQQSQYGDQQPFSSEEQQVQQTRDYFTTLAPTSPVSMIPALRTTMVINAGNSAHNHRVCSTWGNFHFKTFDGDIFQFPGLCNYVFASHCKSSYEDFNVQIRRLVVKNVTVISHVVLKLDGVAVELTSSSITVNGEPVQLPYNHLGVLMERISGYLKIQGKIGVTLLWNEDDCLLLELNEKYTNQTCGLCGDFNQIATYNEFFSNNIQLTPLQFGNMQKMDGPTEQCEDPVPLPGGQCSQKSTTLCQNILTGHAFEACNALVDVRDYIDACIQDLCQCDQSVTEVCVCNTFAEYSRQCSHAGGQPLEWRTEDFCPKSCPFNMQHRECGSPCFDTCTNSEQSQLCEDHCIDGCFCPPGTVFDDINNSGCIPISDCYCTYNGDSYAPGTSFSSQCISCSCTGGQWTCISLSCPGICSIEGGSHISTFDEKYYSFFGDCSYMFTKLCDSNAFAVLGEIQKCGLTETETCLKGLAINIDGGQTVIVIKSNGAVYVNMILTQLPISASNVTIFSPTSFFTVVDTKFGIQLVIQFIPIMQLFIYIDPSHKGQTCGLCGNFNGIQTDDFKAISGVTEGTPAAFANTWKTQADCPNVKNVFENPCTLSIENEKYALHWCGLLTDTKGPFQKCHPVVNPAVYHTNCMFDTCNCEKSEDCMCAALSAYVRACAAKGVLLSTWRTTVCAKFQICPETWTYHYNIETCQATCRALSEVDVTCKIKFPPLDGCTCEEGTYLDDSGKCVPASKCPCYHKGSAIPSGEVIHDNGIMCTCVQGKLQCIGEVKPQTDCDAPMVYFDCDNATANAHGVECQKSCQTLDMGCYSAQCASGCVCPDQLVSDGTGKCIPAEECPCVHNEATYKPGETIKDKCNTCTCKNRKWICSNKPCLETCSVYGDGHYITFDDKRYAFNGVCEYTLVQNQCKNKTNVDTFRIITENIPCGSTGTTCSKAIKVFAGNYELLLTDGKFKVIERLLGGGEVPFKIRYMGIYMVIEIFNGGVIVIWDKKTTVFIKLRADFKGEVCGLCGNYDGNDINDFTTRSQSVVGDVLEFGNSWKVSPTCPDVPNTRDPCSANPYRSSWAQRQCSIINSKTFALCHPQVEPTKYYEACVSDACACDTGGDCECFCTAVAAYAQACQEAGACIAWRTPSICPLFCDYYNKKGECEWHYQPCGSSCMKTCRNPYNCSLELYNLEGCYPKCPDDKPYFNEDEMDCVSLDKCGCFDDKGNYYKPGEKLPSEKSCQSCYCSMDSEEDCRYDENECYCIYEGKISKPGEIIYNTTDGIGGCITAICSQNGTIERNIFLCSTTPTSIPTTTVFVFTNTTSPASTTSVPMTTSVCVQEVCNWSAWYDGMQPGSGNNDGDFETFDNLRAKGYQVCKTPKAVECRAEKFPNTPLTTLGQKVECSRTVGLICNNLDQHPDICHNYQIKILCCSFVPCGNYTTAPIPETTTVSPVQTTTVPATILTSTTAFTSTIKGTTKILTTTPETTVLPTSTTIPSTMETGSSTTEMTTCKPICKWTEWYDVHFPTLDNEGDFETYDVIKATGKDICENPEHIECRAEKFPNKTIDEIGQKVQCNVSFGFVCRNEDQLGMLQICYNYQIKVYCCNNECLTTPTETSTRVTTPQTTSTIITTTSGTTNPNITTPQRTSTPETTTITLPPATTKYTTTLPTISTTKFSTTTTTIHPSSTTAPLTTTFLPTTSEPTRVTTTIPLPTTTQTQIPTTIFTTGILCSEEKCEWSQWYDISYPGNGLDDGDFETFENIRDKGHEVCKAPKNVECQALKYPNASLEELNQNVTCNTKVGLICYNKDQETQICNNYKIRIQCCKMISVPCQTTPISKITTTSLKTTKIPTSILTTTKQVTKTTEKQIFTQYHTTKRPSTAPQIIETTSFPTTATSRTSHPVSTTTPFRTPTREVITTTGPPTTTLPTTSRTTKKTTPTITTKVISPTTPILTTTALPTTTQLPTPTTTLTTTTPPMTTCAPVTCQWSEWFDVVFPTSGPEGGDLETYSNIRAAGGRFCEKPINIQCEAVNHPDLSIEQLGQVVQCDVTVGLICYNKDQTGETKQCFNFRVRVLCCEENPECKKTTVPPTSTVITTTSSTTKETTPTITTTVISPTTPIVTTTALPTTTQLPTPTTTLTTTAPPTTTCAPVTCQWSEWFDVVFPTSGPEGGDLETYSNIRAAGGRFCEKPIDIKCEAVNHPDLSIEQLGQVVQCDVTVGLICYNKDQTGETKQCFNFRVRVLCCEENPECKKTTVPPTSTVITTTSSTTKETTPRITTTVISPTTPIGTTTALPTTTQLPTPTTTLSTTTPPTTTCAPVTCQWSEWFDVVFPTSGPEGGDLETYSNIRAAGGRFCEKPIDIKCEAVNHPDLSIEQLGQVVQCDVTVGLICYNKDQTGETKQCFNFRVRVLCCEENPECKKTTVPPTSTVITTTSSTTKETTPRITTTVISPTTPIGTTTPECKKTTVPPTSTVITTTSSTTKETTPRITTTVISPTTPIGTTTALPTTTQLPTPTTTLSTTAPPTTTCAPVTCQWSEWFDVVFPTSGPEGGDLETYSNIRAAGGRFCEKPIDIKCEAVNHPDLSIEQLGQVVQCDVTVGLICYNKDQTGETKQCFNFRVRVLCCEENPECKKTTVPPTSTVITTTSSTTKETTPRITTTVISPTTPIGTTTPECKKTTLPPTSTVITTTSSTTKETTPTITTTVISPTTPIVTTTALPTTTQLPTPTTTLTTTAPPTTTCAPVTCQWSEWFDVVFPTSGPEGGDLETYSNIRAAGGRFCEKPINIQCEAVNHPDLSIEQLGQVVQCDVTVGLICYNKDQTGKTKQCFNFRVRVLCCEENPECKKTTVPPTSTVITTTSSTTKETTPRITTTVISPTTPIGTTTALPTTTQLPTPTTTLSTTAPPTTTCAPVTCQWSEWFDVVFPTSGPEGGDLETYSNIRAAGGRFCEKPINIQCEAVNHPDLSIEQLGQVVQCDVTVGLICYNKDQTGETKQCFNFRVRVLCCEENPECKKTTLPPTSTVITTTSSTTKETTPTITTTVISPTTPIVTTTALPTTTQLPTPTTTLTTTAPPMTTCVPVTCQWSEWFDVDFPASGPEGGDLETYSNIRAAGGRFCEKPINIQCRAVNHPDLSIEQVGQVVQCNVTAGLICYNKDQTGKSKMCYNYEISVLCCEANPECKKTTVPPTSTVITTTSSTTKETTPRITTTVISPTTPIGTTTALPTTTQLPTPTTTLTTTAPPTTTCVPVTCQWSEWFDVVFPTSGPEGGDLETYSNIRAAGGRFCEKPIDIQCEAVNHPDLSIEQVGQVVQCDVTVGLICYNKDQTGKTKQCFNFRVRVLCCEENPECKKTTVPPTSTVITTTSSTTKETTPTITTTVISPTTPIGTTTALPTTTQLPTPTTTLSTTAPPTTTCAPVTCQWSEWFDVVFPTSGPEGGDLETYSNIRAAGGRFCEKPINIQCRAVNHPDLSIEQVGQVVQCNVTAGLICYNKDQTGKSKMCYNYEISVLCCEENPECKKTTVPPTSTVITTTSSTTKETTPTITTTVISPTTPIGTTTALPTTTQLPTPTTTLSTTAPPTTTCAPVTCQWSEWFDVVFPTSGPEGGDLETYSNIRAAGGRFCEKPIDIQCEAVNHPDLSIEQVGQVVQCDVTVGLICYNKDQTGKTKQCFNFRVRVLCCEENPECKKTTVPPTSTVITTTSSTTKETTPRITTTVISPTTPIGTTTALPTTTQLPTPTTTLSTTAPPTTTCAPVTCQWSEWFDVVFPTSGPEGGDLETYSNIRAAGGRFCEKPINIQCEAVNHPDLSIEQLGQVVQCDVTVGLICYNKDQTGETKQCFNFRVRVLCCEENPECKKTTLPPTSTVITTTSSTTKETTPTITTTVISPTTPIVTTTALPTTTQLPTPTTTLTTTAPPTTTCAPVTCQWSEWFDAVFPTSGPEGGDLETYSNIRAAGGRFCEKPIDIQCEAVNHPDLSIEQVGQVVQCDVTVGLICYNKDQTGKTKQCFNFRVRVLCCEENPECKKTTVPPTSTVITTTSSTTKETTPRITTTVISPTTPIGTTTALPTTTQLPTPTTTLSTTAPPTTTCAPVTCQWSEWFDVVFPTSGPEGGDLETYSNIRAAGGRFCEKPIDIQCEAVNHPDLSIEQVGQVVQCDVTVGLICYNKDQTGKTKQCFNFRVRVLCCEENPECKKTTVPPTSTVITTTSSTTKETTPRITTTVISPTTPIGTTTALPTTTQLPTPTTTLSTTAPPTTTCAPVTCQWSEWFDVVFPTSGPEGGDLETYSNIRAAGGRFCEKPINIQCEAVNHPDLSIEQLGQVVQCDVTVGLICYNKDQTGETKQCFNFRVRVLCCEENPECKKTTLPPTSTVITTTSSTTKETTPTITTTVISPTTPIVTTTALPTTTQLPTPTTTLTTTAPPTTTCAPVTCQWSEWFDAVFPTSGPEGGDLETYSNIRAAGGRFCEKPIDIQCQAVNHPDLSIEQLGQVVQCDVTVGLICYNKDQTGKTKQCFNFRVRVLCCEENPECKTTTLPPTTTSSSTLPGSTMTQEVITTMVPQPTSSITSSTTTIGSSTSHCFCQIGENIYMPGEVIYKQTDSDGCLYFAICDSTCSIERYKGPCVSTTTKPTSTPTIVSTTPTTSTAGTTLPPGCPDAVPPREEGETWIQNCTKATCLGNNNIVISKVECPPVQKIICENGYAPVKVLSKDGCCYHYECECICSGWGDPHFITFDGVYYTFQDNCTYVLVQQIIPKYNNFKILIDNYYCDTEDQLSCPQSIIIHYKSSVIVLTHQHFNGIDINKIYFNGKLIKTSFQKDGIYIYTIGIDMVVEISEIETFVTYSGTIFSVKLPFSKFYNNTEGQCGTCTNNIKDECRLPNGEVTDCPHMAPHWRVPDPKKNYCFGPTPSVPTEITPLPEICSTAPLCSLILNEIFSECHEIIPPDPYFRGCIFDACHMKNISMQCSGLEIYASLCASKGVCIDWRGKTNDKCPFSCPTDKVYDPCGPINPPTCDNSGPPQTGITEGCFCKNGTKLFSTHRDICVSDCGCTGPDGLPKVPGETWISNCQKCICEEYSLMVQCIEEPCPTKTTPVECSFEGFVPITILTPEEKCCPQKHCVCNTSHCPGSVETCPLGYELKKENLPGDCCINTTCVKVPGCVVDGKFYSPGAVIPRGLCESCKCSEKEDLENNVECVSKTCDQRCPLGYEYQEVSGQCCGQCMQIACVLTLGSSPTQVIKPGEIWYPPGNNCTSYECDLVDNQYITVTIKKTCLQWDPNCPPEYVKPADDGCCKKCEQIEFCAPINITKTIKYNGCESSSPIEVTHCEGQCDSFSKYSYKANMMNHTCTCCQEQKTTKKQVTLICPDGLTMDYSYLYVDKCECVKSECNIWPTPAPQELSSFPPQQQEQQQQQQQQQEQQKKQQEEKKSQSQERQKPQKGT